MTIHRHGQTKHFPDYTKATWFLAAMIYLGTIFMFLFHTKYRRMEVRGRFYIRIMTPSRRSGGWLVVSWLLRLPRHRASSLTMRNSQTRLPRPTAARHTAH